MDNNEGFNYTYSAKEQEEIKTIRKKYAVSEEAEDKMTQLRRLDASVYSKASTAALAVGIVGALILGQAAVEASIISPILIIVISLTGLGGYAIPSYGLSVGVQIARMAFVVLGGLLGIYGLVLGVALMTGYLSQMESFGEKYLAPLAPHYPHNGDIVVRLPLFMQTRTLFTVARDSWLQRTRRAQRPWRKRA